LFAWVNCQRPISGQRIPNIMKLKAREIQILTCVARGDTSIKIAGKLNLSKRTIDFHINNARLKLQARTRAEATVRAVTRGLIKP
jgi:DNA-binding NarL/FixJ family response regulator